MTELVRVFVFALAALGLVALGWWLLIATEGVYLGRRAVIWLYDLYANRYDHIKDFEPEYEHWLLAQPILSATAPHRAPLVLDVATGTGRLPLALLNHPAFQGRVVGVDLSRRMLRIAARKLHPFYSRVDLIWGPAEKLPFADDFFDVVTCLESLEFMIDREWVLQEMIRVLRPGGLLLVSNRINTHAMPGKTWSQEQLDKLLIESGIELVESEPWQMDYQRVWAIKAGDKMPTGARPLDEALRCPRCRENLMVRQDGTWVCQGCKGQVQVGSDGVIELFPLYL